MTDNFGNELNVGDKVVYIFKSSGGALSIEKGTITEIYRKNLAKIDTYCSLSGLTSKCLCKIND